MQQFRARLYNPHSRKSQLQTNSNKVAEGLVKHLMTTDSRVSSPKVGVALSEFSALFVAVALRNEAVERTEVSLRCLGELVSQPSDLIRRIGQLIPIIELKLD